MSKKSNIAIAAKRIGVTAITAGLTLSPFMPIASYADELNDANTQTTGDAFDGKTIGENVGTGATATKLTLDDLIARAKQRVEDQQKVVDNAKTNLDVASTAVSNATTKTTKAQQDYDAVVASQNADEVAALQKLIDEKKQALDELEKKQDNLKNLQAQLDDANTDASNKQLAYAQAQQNVTDAKAALDKAEQDAKDATPEKLNAAKDAYDQAKQAYDEAVAAKDKAESDLNAANGAVTGAQAGVDAANGKLTEAQNAAATAKSNLQNAQSAYDTAKAAYDAVAGDDPDKLADKIDAAKTKMDTAKTELDAATAADSTAQANLTAAQNAVPAAQAKVDSANAAVSSAQAAYDQANEKLAGVTDTYNSAKTAYEQAQKTEADKKAEYDRLVEVRQQQKASYDSANAAYKKSEQDYNAATEAVKNLEKQISDLKATMTVDQDIINQGIIGFMNYIIVNSSFTEQQKNNASDAVLMLTSSSHTDWYNKYVDQDKARSTNPLSLEQMRNALTYLDTHNNIRKANGQSELSISLRMTAAAVLNASYSSNVWGHSDVYWDNAENLASGGGAYTGGDTIDTLGWPYTGLYTQEKAEFDKYVQNSTYGSDLEAHRYDSWYIYQHYNNVSQACGHYLNIIDKDAKAFGVGTGSGKTEDGSVSPSMVTIFDYSNKSSSADFTVAEFKKILNDYIDSAYNAGGTQEQKEQLHKLQEQLAAAQKDFGAKGTDYINKSNAALDAQASYLAADKAMKSSKTDYDNAKASTASAKKSYDAAVAALGGIDIDTLKSNLDKAKANASNAQSELDMANANLADCKKTAADTASRKSKAQIEYDSAKSAYDSLTGTDVAGAKDRLDKATAALNEAKTADSDAQTAVAHANNVLSDAKSKLNDANVAKTNAKSAYDKAVVAVSTTKNGMDTAKTTYDSLSAAANGVNSAKKNLADAQNAETDAKATFDKANDTVNALNGDIQNASAAVSVAKSTADAKSATYDDVIANKADYIAGTKTTGNADVDAMFKSVRDKQSAVDQAKAGLDAAKAEHGEVSDAYAAAKKIYDDAVAELNSRQAELDALLAHKRDDEKKSDTSDTGNDTSVVKPAAIATRNDVANGDTTTTPGATNGKLPQTGEEPNFAAAISVIGGAIVASGVILKKKRQ